MLPNKPEGAFVPLYFCWQIFDHGAVYNNKYAMVFEITWAEIQSYWCSYLWPDRSSPVESTSAMQYLGGYAGENMQQRPTFFGYLVDDLVVGVNSGHMCSDGGYRSRGLWVNPVWRNRGIGKELLLATIDKARQEGADYIWSLPRRTSWKTYQGAGFILSSDWFSTETSGSNAYCVLKLR